MPSEERATTLSVLLFRVRNTWLALKTIWFVEVANLGPICAVPFRTNRYFRGLVNVNGELLLCFSLVDVLELTEAEQAAPPTGTYYPPRILVIQRDGDRYAFVTDEVAGIANPTEKQFSSDPALLALFPKLFVTSVVENEGRLAGLLDEDKLFSVMAARIRAV